MSDQVSLPQIQEAVRRLRAFNVPPLRVETQEQADRMTAADPFGYVWCVNELYFLVPYSPPA